jgi:hypothetical protein
VEYAEGDAVDREVAGPADLMLDRDQEPARIALHGAFDRRRVVVYGSDPLSVAAASNPDIMPRISRSVLAGLDELSVEDRGIAELTPAYGIGLRLSVLGSVAKGESG